MKRATPIQAINTEVQKMIDGIIASIPESEHPDIKRICSLGSGGSAFTVNFSTIMKSPGMVMSPFFYDFPMQRDKLIEIIRKSEVPSLQNVIDEIYETGKYKHDKFNPEFLARVKESLYGKTPASVEVNDFGKVKDKTNPYYGYEGKVEAIENGKATFFLVKYPKGKSQFTKGIVSIGHAVEVPVESLQWADGDK